MAKLLQVVVFLVLIWPSKPVEAFLLPGLDIRDSRTQRDVHCREHEEYKHGNICCLNCPAGTRLVSPCTTARQRGKCEECDDGTFTQHSNNLDRCIRCNQCPPGQEIVRPCTHTQNSECQCKAGRFCVPDEPCEVCRNCSRCKADEEVVRQCTPTANTQCKKTKPESGSASANTAWIAAPVLITAALVVVFVFLCVWRQRRATGSRRNLPGRQKAGQHYSDISPAEEGGNRELQGFSRSSLSLPQQLVRTKPSTHTEDERKVLCESLNSSASNSQHSLTSPAFYSCPAPLSQVSPMVPQQPNRRVDEFPELVPVNGEESLRKCFEYFEEVDITYHKRFFRNLGINENVIRSKEHLPYIDKMHDLLNIWIEKEGREASLNDLLRALLDLNQRLTADNIKDSAIHHGHYFCKG